MKVYTIRNDEQWNGAKVAWELPFGDGKRAFSHIGVGEAGRNRRYEFLTIQNWNHPADEDERLMDAALRQTRKGGWALHRLTDSPANRDGRCLVVNRSTMGFRGGVQMVGDRHDCCWPKWCEQHFPPDDSFLAPPPQRRELAGVTVLITGQVADGSAGRMGSGLEYVFTAEPGAIWCVRRTGRLYGNPSGHYWRWDGSALETATAAERIAGAVDW